MSFLSDLSIRRPVFAWILMLAILLFGFLSFQRLGISQLPDVDFPVVNISVTWTGASPIAMEAAVTDVIEDAVLSIEGIRQVNSSVQEGRSNTSVEFELSRNIDSALQEVQSKLAQAVQKLPIDVQPPVIRKSNPEDQPILWGALTGGESLRDRILFARNELKDKITTVSGVGDVNLGGYLEPNMRIWLNNDRMIQNQITVTDVTNAIRSGSTLTPTGSLEQGMAETSLRIRSEASTVGDFENILIPSRGGQPIYSQIRIKDVARVEAGLEDVRRVARLNGEPAVGFGVIKQRGANSVAVGEAVKRRFQELQSFIPSGMKLQAVTDSTRFIRDSTHELIFNLVFSSVLTALVCWMFLGSLSSALNVIIAIPVSLVGTFIVFAAFGFTLNTFTLLALSLSIGIVVDDAIMVLENIVRNAEKGMDRVKASIVGAREISGAAIAATLAIVAIFIPVVFMDGMIGRYFFQFGIAMSGAVLVSLLEALTLAPMRCSQFLYQGEGHFVSKWINLKIDQMGVSYQRILGKLLLRRAWVLGFGFLLFIGSLFLVKGLRKEFVPAQDQNRFMISLQTPMGSSLIFTENVVKKIEVLMQARPEVKTVFVIVGGFGGGLVNQASMFVTLEDAAQRKFAAPFTKKPTQQEFMDFARSQFKGIEGLTRSSLIDLSLGGFGSGRGYPIQFEIQGPDWNELGRLVGLFLEKMKSSDLMTDSFTSYNPNMPEIEINPDPEKAAKHGVTVENIATALSSMVGSVVAGKYTDEKGRRSDVRIKLEDQFKQNIIDLNRIYVRNNRGEMIPLADVMTTKKGSSVLTIDRYNRERTLSLNANIAKGKSQDQAIATIDRWGKELLPDGYKIVYTGNSKTSAESFSSLMWAMILGMVVAYMVLAVQYNSFVHPVTVLLALPFSFIGAFGALWLTGVSLNIYSLIGLLLLMGIVKKNSILLVDFTNQVRATGKNVRDALLEACPIRLRPILMTSIATIAGVTPIALAFGPGAETIRPMAIVVIGGVTTSTLLTLFVVPCAYSALSWFERKSSIVD